MFHEIGFGAEDAVPRIRFEGEDGAAFECHLIRNFTTWWHFDSEFRKFLMLLETLI